MQREFRERVVFITGGSSGIGLAAAERFAQAGARVALLAHESRELREAVRQLSAGGGAVLPLAADVASAEEMRQSVETILDRWGRLDVVFANAGINGVWAPLDQLQPEEWEHTIAVNLTGTYHTLRFAVPHMKERGGAILITSSVNGTRMFSNTGATAYACTKAAQAALAKMLALELAEHRIRVNVICPGAIETEIEDSTERRNLESAQEPVEFPEGKVPLTDGKPGSADDVARLALFLASDDARHISGTEVWIDGAQSLLQG